MDNKDVKKLLKDTKKSIQDKNFEKALALGKEIIKLDPLNYNGLVFLGFSAQELGLSAEAEDTLRKATVIDPKQLLAWKGLSTLYEKNPTKENQLKLVTIYEKLSHLQISDVPKQKEVIVKLITLTSSLELIDKNIEANLVNAEICDSAIEKFTSLSIVAHQLGSSDIGNQDLVQLEKTFKEALNCSVEDTEKVPLRKNFMRFLKEENRLVESLDEARHLLAVVSPDDYEPLSFICKVFIETSAVGPSLVPNDLDEVFELSELLRQSQNPLDVDLALITQGAILLARKEPWKALAALSECAANLNLTHTFVLLARAELDCHCYKHAERTVVNGLKTIPKTENELIGILCLILSISLIAQKRKDEAFKTLTKSREKLGITNSTELCYLRWCLLACDQENAEKIISKLNTEDLTSAEKNDLLFLRSKYEFQMNKNFAEAIKLLEFSIEVCQKSDGLHLRAVILWESGQHAQALEALVQAIKSDPYHPRNYLYLGDYYRAKENERRACQCYLKGHQLDSCDEELAKRASDSLLKLEDTITNRDVLKKTTDLNPRAQWAWLRLGVSYLPTEQAVIPLQIAVRLDDKDSASWECLGDAYYNQGNFSAATKAYKKVIELKPEATYPIFRVAMIKKLSGFPEEALIGFNNVLDIDPSYIAAVEGLTESCLNMAQDYVSQSLFELAKESCFKGLQVLPESLLHEHNASCLWKLSGDLNLLLASLGPNHYPLKSEGRPPLVPDSQDNLISSAVRCYGHALAVRPDISWLWQDMGLAYSHLNSEEAAYRAAACFHQALVLNPSEASHWRFMGTLLQKHIKYFDPNMAQHCFIKALQLDPSCVISWTALGLLYFDVGEVNLANVAFTKAQAVDPAYGNAWLGQAMVAESISPTEAFDLYRHATLLSQHTSILVRYGLAACSMLLEEGFSSEKEQHQHVIHATDCLQHVTANDQSSGPVLNTLSIFLERQNLLESALEASKRSLELLPAAFKEPARINLARILRCLGRSSEALDVFSTISGSGDEGSLCELALAHWTLGNWEQAFKAYQQVQRKCAADVKSHLFVAMAMVANKMEKFDVAIKLLLQSFTHRPVSVAGVVATSAMAYLLKNTPLLKAALSELTKHLKHSDEAPIIANLLALSTNNPLSAVRRLSSSVHQHPATAALWAQLSSHLLRLQDGQHTTSSEKSPALHCALASTLLLKTGHKRTQKLFGDADQLSSLLSVVAASLADGKVEEAIKEAQAVAHAKPDDVASWSCLLACLLANNKWSNSVYQRILLSQKNAALLEWLNCCFVYYHLLNGREKEAMECLQKMKGSGPSSDFLRCALGTIKDIEAFLEYNPYHTLAWKVLISRQVRLSEFSEASTSLHRWLEVLHALKKPQSSRLTPLLMLGLVSWEAMQKAKEDEERKRWLSLGEESINQVLKDTRKCAAAFLIAAQFAKIKGNTKFEKKFLNQCSALCNSKSREMVNICQLLLSTESQVPVDNF